MSKLWGCEVIKRVISFLSKTKNCFGLEWGCCCIVKHLSLDIANATWELLKVMDSANLEAVLKLHHVTKYVIHTKILGLRLSQAGTGKKHSISFVLVAAIMQGIQLQENV